MVEQHACPDQSVLRALLDGTLVEAEQQELNRHVEECATCQQSLDQLAATSWEQKARQFGARAPAEPVPEALQDVMREAQAQVMDSETQALDPADSAADADAVSHTAREYSYLGPPAHAGNLGRLEHYECLEAIGKGGFGVVFKARDEKLDRLVAIKVLTPALAGNGTARKRFVREAKAVAAFRNDHVIAIHAVGDTAPVPFLVMELIVGVSLQDKLDRHGPLGVKEILRIGMQIADGLAAAHRQGLVHRDIKPANILLENGVERVKITDFGLARAVDDASMTQSGTVAGTPMYMSPEQAEGLAVDHRSDLFSLGTVLYAMCTGHPPFRASGTHAVLKRVIEATPRPIREVNPDIPDWLEAIIAKLHAKKPEDRFQKAAEVADLLGQHLAFLQQPATAPKPPAVVPLRRAAQPTIIRARARGTGMVVRRRELLNGKLVAGNRLWLWTEVASLTLLSFGIALLSFNYVIGGSMMAVGVVLLIAFLCMIRSHMHTVLPDVITDLCSLAQSLDKNYRLTILAPNGWTTASMDLVLSGAGFEIVCARRLVRGWFPLNPLAAEFGSNYDVIVTVNAAAEEIRSEVAGLLQARYSSDRNQAPAAPEQRARRVPLRTKLTASIITLIGVGLVCSAYALGRSGSGVILASAGMVLCTAGFTILVMSLVLLRRSVKLTGMVLFAVLVGVAGVPGWWFLLTRPQTIDQADPDSPLFSEFGGPGWTRLGDGINWTGWKVYREHATPYYETVNRMPRNYHLRMAVRGESGAEGTIFLHNPPIEQRGDPAGATGDWHVDLIDNEKGHMDLAVVARDPAHPRVANDTAHTGAVATLGEWFRLEIIAKDDSTAVLVNGRDVGTLNHRDYAPSAGVLCLCNTGLNGTHLSLRNIEFKDLTAPAFKDDQERLQGRWVAESVDNGRELPKDMVAQFSMTIVGNRWNWRTPLGPSDSVFHLNEAANPKQIDIIGDDHHGQFGIYRFDGERLVVCIGDDAVNDRPTEFASKERRLVMVFKRVLPPPLAVAPFDAKTAKEHQDAWARHLGVPVEIENTIGMKLRLIPPGEFLMGSSPEEVRDAIEDAVAVGILRQFVEGTEGSSLPRHKVRLSTPFRLGTCEVTVGQFRLFVKDTGHRTTVERNPGAKNRWETPGWTLDENQPVTHVSYDDARGFCRWLSQREGLTYELPTEAQWEFACRAGSPGLWTFGDDVALLKDHAWYGLPNATGPAQVGRKQANAFGLYDMHGNIQEWCFDWHEANFYRESPTVDPVCGDKERKTGVSHALRGGWWGRAPTALRSAARSYGPIDYFHYGFRVALVGDLRPTRLPKSG